jgi:glutathione S-transferase
VFLGDKPFFLGEEMCTVDCACFGQLVMIATPCCEGLLALVDAEPQLQNLTAFVQRVKAKLWSDLD